MLWDAVPHPTSENIFPLKVIYPHSEFCLASVLSLPLFGEVVFVSLLNTIIKEEPFVEIC